MGEQRNTNVIGATATIPATDADAVVFGFTQIVRRNKWQAWYGGRKSSDGSIGLDWEAARAPETVMLDQIQNVPEPWFNKPLLGTTRNGRSASTGDLPALSCL